MKRLKIGVLTFHRCINYGSYWQARSLVEGLASKGHDAVILDHYSAGINIKEWRCAHEPLLPKKVPDHHAALYGRKIRRFFSAFEQLPLTRPFNIHQLEDMNDFDVVVVGSDEVWNLSHPWYGSSPLFYGEGEEGGEMVNGER